MKVKRIGSSLLAFLAVSILGVFPSHAQSNPEETSIEVGPIFECKKIEKRGQENYWTVMNIRGGAKNEVIQSYEIIEWINHSPLGYGVGEADRGTYYLVNNPDYNPEAGRYDRQVPVPNPETIITTERRCQTVSQRLDALDLGMQQPAIRDCLESISPNVALSQQQDEIINCIDSRTSNLDPVLLSTSKVSEKQLRGIDGSVLTNWRGEPFTSSPWVICAIEEPRQNSCNRNNMLFTIPVTETDNEVEANQILQYFVNLINNPGEFGPLQI